MVPPPLVPTPPPSVTDPVRFPVALAKVPVPPTIWSVSVPTPGKDGLGWHTPGQVKLLGNSWMKIMPPARLMVRTSHSGWVPQTKNWIASVAWPNGMTCPCPQELVSGLHPLLTEGTSGSVNVMLTGTVVAAIAGEARAVGRSMRAPEASASASTRFIVRPPSGADAARFLGCRCRAMAKWCKATSAHRGWSTGAQRKPPAADSGGAASHPLRGIIALGHFGLTGENSDPQSLGVPAPQNSWATGTNSAVDSIYQRLAAVDPAFRGHAVNAA